MNPREIFHCTAQFELRAEGDNGNLLVGYAAVFDVPYETEYFREFVRPGAFARALREKQDVRGLINHDSNQIMGRLSANTLRLTEDSKGLRFEIDMPDRSDARDLRESIKRKDITGCSFGFRAVKQEWDDSGIKPTRSLLDVDLFDVGPVTFPAYDDTTVAIRSLEQWRNQNKPKIAPLSIMRARQQQAIALGM